MEPTGQQELLNSLYEVKNQLNALEILKAADEYRQGLLRSRQAEIVSQLVVEGNGTAKPKAEKGPGGRPRKGTMSPTARKNVADATKKRCAEYRAWGCTSWAQYKKLKAQKANGSN
jgi:hypothetical protein